MELSGGGKNQNPTLAFDIFYTICTYVLHNILSVSDVCLAGVNEMDSGLFKFFGGIMDFGDQSPEYCWIECQRQGLAAEDSKIPFIGIANATLCFCGIDYENKVEGK